MWRGSRSRASPGRSACEPLPSRGRAAWRSSRSTRRWATQDSGTKATHGAAIEDVSMDYGTVNAEENAEEYQDELTVEESRNQRAKRHWSLLALKELQVEMKFQDQAIG